jgi:pimeloyl-ACP methyl ester carboxylesterase
MLSPHNEKTLDRSKGYEAVIQAASASGRTDLNGILLDIAPDANTLMISCSGVVPWRIIYHMELTSVSIETHKIYLCDYRNFWYYRGIENITNTMDQTIEVVRAVIEKLQPERTIAMGTSGGGYMAMLLGARLGLSRVIAFAPQTDISRMGRAALDDERWEKEMARIYAVCGDGGTYDIREQVATSASKITRFHVFYSDGDKGDVGHAERLKDLDNVRLYRIATEDHNVSRALKDRGLLGRIVKAAIRDYDDELELELNEALGSTLVPHRSQREPKYQVRGSSPETTN